MVIVRGVIGARVGHGVIAARRGVTARVGIEVGEAGDER